MSTDGEFAMVRPTPVPTAEEISRLQAVNETLNAQVEQLQEELIRRDLADVPPWEEP